MNLHADFSKGDIIMNKILLSVLSLLLLTLSACGGGGSTGTTGATNPPTGTAGGIVSLSGVVVSGTSVAGVAVGALPAASNTVIKGVFANALIIAADKNGNTITSTSDRTGKFTLKLTSGISYAIIFLDGKTQKLLGSLVQAGNTTVAGSVALSGNSNLGNIVINPKTQKAISENDANGTLKASAIGTAPASMKSTNGVITQSAINQVTTNNLTNGNAAAITQISVADFFAKPNTWWSAVNMWTDSYSGVSGTDYTLAIADSIRTTGAAGTSVNATKNSEVVYYSSYNDPTTPANNSMGYYSNMLGYPNYVTATFTAPPATFDFLTGPWTWASAHYADAPNNQMYVNYSFGDPASTWMKEVPLNITVGKAVSVINTDPYGTTNNTFTVSLAKEKGIPFVLTDTKNISHPVIQVDIKSIWTPNPTTCATCGGVQTSTNSIYVVGGYGGVSINVKGSTGAIRTPSVALATVQFGNISTSATTGATNFINVNPLVITTAKLINTQRDQMLSYIWQGRTQTGIVPTQNNGGTATTIAFQPYFYVNYDIYGNAATPASWDPATYMSKYLTAGAASRFTTNINYATGATGATFNLEFRQVDPITSNSVLITGSQGMAIVGSATNKVDTLLPISGAVTVPTLAALSNFNKYTYFDPVTNTNITEGNTELWMIMKDANGTLVMEQMLDSYLIH